MPRRSVFRPLLFVIFALCQVSESKRPDISPDQEEIVINEGAPLDITCTTTEFGSNRIKFIYPVANGEAFNTSAWEINEHDENGVRSYVFQRPLTLYGDTGWYGCADQSVEIVPGRYDDPDVNWLYVYVASDTNFFVEADTYAPLHAVSGEYAVIPCRPTSPNLTVSLSNSNELEAKVSFDPRIGFTVRNLTVKDSDWFKCMIEKDGEEHAVNYYLSVLRKQLLSEPKIHDEHLRHVTRGQDLHVNCTAEVEAGTPYVLTWSTPQQSNRTSMQQFRSPNNMIATCQLTIRNLMDADTGEYVCTIKSFHDTKKTKKNITVHDPQVKYINLTPQDNDRYHQGKCGDKVQWVVYVDGYPTPDLHWLNPKGEKIIENQKYTVNTSATSTILKINSLNVQDAGIYTLQATNKEMIETLNFTLDVMAKPLAMLVGIEPYYTPDYTAEFRCNVIGSPPLNVTWSFLKCPVYPRLDNATIVYPITVLQNITETTNAFVSIAKMPVELSGILTCTACNNFDCDSISDNILVSDGIGGFSIIPPKQPVTEGDNVELTCAASIYNYTDIFSWTDETYAPIVETERILILSNKTTFTYRSILKIKNVSKSDAQYYNCNGKYMTVDDTTSPDSASYQLIVHDSVAPYFNKINMNGTKIRTIDLMAEGHKSVFLQCFVGGMPKPIINWYKDNTLLKPNEQYSFEYNNQELHIKYVSLYSGGVYSCRVHNRLKTIEAYQQITIKNAKWRKLDIVLAVSIALLSMLVVVLAIFFTIKVRREKKMRKELMEAGLMHFEEGALECLNPELTVDDQAELLPYDKKWEFPRERLKLGKQLGSGAFGVVMKAEAQGICEDEDVVTVAVKMVRRTTDPTYVRALASELKIMVHLGKHLNVVNLLGACTKNISKRELLVIVEYCRYGNLHNYLLRHRNDFVNQIDPSSGKFDPTIGVDILTRTVSVGSNNSLSANSGTDTVQYCSGTGPDSQEINLSPDGCIVSNNSSQPGWRSNYRGDYKDYNLKPICTQDLLSWAFQVARGMEYLSQRRVLHGDLAARNILLAEGNIVKICDFGLAKTMYKDDNYKKKGDGPLPIKWMAIESIRDRIFSTQSDIWSFGIVLWEFFTLAETPYPGMEAEKQYQKLIEGYRMEQPEYSVREVYDIMLQCWKAKPTLRPSFTQLVESIGNLLEDNVRLHYISLNTPYMDMNTMNLQNGKNDYLTMMSAPDHAVLSSPTHEYVNSPFSENNTDSTYLCMSPNCQKDESGIFSPRPQEDRSHFEFPSPTSDSEEAIELSPMLKQDQDPYLKPINVHERRAEFARQRQAMKNKMPERPIDRDSGYCNARNFHLIDLHAADEGDGSKDTNKEKEETKKKDYTPSIISTQDNYVNMPKQKSDLRRDVPDSFSNPSYVIMSNRVMDQKV